ncbi:putative methyltransferase NDAI_0I02590 [Naumovozyma dairenensis CBS 421]|uniref:Uncharacterized protein n=1 Tax=Naumovozyma dairenensis (strain ATCC 10597 / BCRC 20456 / CBS 421 / NBRC 0211 / NRRL Y-12639) TaxID=1071378 RepID=G0WGB6_NAUDC|nr:hypothetical protein NDAI_0I02590 [Naumovozyma dairenensis CBS 421]CCD26827.1 hypothetical protein NDAI_0I02590 [Naumovozyma dairenensis CBS 421]
MPPKRKTSVENQGDISTSSTNKPLKKKTKHGKQGQGQAIKAKKNNVKKTIKVLSKTLNYSLCIPTSVISNCTNLEQITYTIYQIAKAATFFNAGEIIILDLTSPPNTDDTQLKTKKKSTTKLSDSMLIASLLQYFVTPPYLVNSVFKKQYRQYFHEASKLPRLSALPFMRYLDHGEGNDNHRYREGLAIRMTKPGKISTSNKKEFKQTKFINIGKDINLELKSQLVPINVRVTVDTIEKRVVSPEEAYGDFVGAQASYGYHVRIAKSFGDIFTHCAFRNGYSQSVWINSGDYYYNESLKKYMKIDSKIPTISKIITGSATEDATKKVDAANLLMVYGKWDHIKQSFNASKDQFEGCEGAQDFFDGQFELPGMVPQGNVPIQDACMISLSSIQALI